MKTFSKNSIALAALKKAGEGHEIIEIDGKFAVVTHEEAAAHKAALEQIATELTEVLAEVPTNVEGDELQQKYDSEGTVTIVADLGVNPTTIGDRSKFVVGKQEFGKTRYVIQQKTSDGKRAFLPATGEELVAWKFWAAQYDSVEAANEAIAGEQDLSVVPFRKAWLETFMPKEGEAA